MIKTKKTLKLLMTFMFTVLYLLMPFAQLSTVFASEPITQGTEEAPAASAITKVLQIPNTTIVPTVDFKFTVTPVSVDNIPYTNTPSDNMPTVSDITLSYSSDDNNAGSVSNNVRTIKKQSGNIFAGKTFPHAGEYVYLIKETSGTYAAIDDAYETMDYSPAEYTLRVYVKNKVTPFSGTFIFAISSTVGAAGKTDVNNPINQTPATKVDSAPGDGVSTFSSMTFTNNYTKTNGAGIVPGTPDPTDPSKVTLTVSKSVVGEFGNQTEYFTFSVLVNAPAFISGAPIYHAYVLDSTGTVISDPSTSGNYTGTNVADGGGVNKYITFTSGQAEEVKLKHSQKLVFVNTHVGTTYTITELAAEGYTPTCDVTTNGDAPIAHNGELGGSLLVEDQIVGESTNIAAFKNTRDEVTPAGFNLNNLPFIILISVAAVGLGIFLIMRLRKR